MLHYQRQKDETGQGLLQYICKYLDYWKIDNPNRSEKIQCADTIDFRRISIGSEKNNILNLF